MRSPLLVPAAISFLLSCGIIAQTPPPAPENLAAKVNAIFQKMDSTVSPGCALSDERRKDHL
jgi:hypothetical protein